jgi:hypothetical protein
VALRVALNTLADAAFDVDRRRQVVERLKEEIDRIDVTRIASLIHPNREGASRYADVVHKRAEGPRQTVSLRERMLAFLPPTQRNTPPDVIEVGKTIRRFGFDPAAGLKACFAHAEPDVLGLVVHTHLTSDLLSREVFLDLGDDRRKLRHLLMRDLTGDLELNPHLQPGTRDFFTIDVAGQMQIGDITRLLVDIGQDIGGSTWRPESVTFSIDGRDVHTVDTLPEVTSVLDLHFPT